MNKLIVLASLCALFISIQCEDDENEAYLCRISGGDQEKLSALADCINTSFPQKLVDIIAQCYERINGQAGNTHDYLRHVCAQNSDQEKLQAMVKCMDDEGDNVEGITQGDIDRAAQNSETCFAQKLGQEDK